MGQYDAAKRRKVLRKQRERGAWVYVPAVELEAAGIDTAAPLFYRIWPTRSGKRKVLLQFYTDG